MRRYDAALNMLAFIAILLVFVVIDRRRERRRRVELASILRGVVWLIQRSPDAWRIVLQLCADADSLRAGCSNGALSRRYRRRRGARESGGKLNDFSPVRRVRDLHKGAHQ
jgi:hypothetical protein